MNTIKNKKYNLTRLLFIVLLLLSSFTSFAQNIKPTAKLDTDNIAIGKQVKLLLSVTYKVDNGKYTKINWPIINDTLRKEVEVVSQSKIDTIVLDKNNPFQFVETKTLYITSFDSGYWAIPPFLFSVQGDSSAIPTDPLLLHVGTVAVDTTQSIKDIKQPFSVNYSWIDWLKDNKYFIVGILALLILSYYFYKWYKKMQNNKKSDAVPKSVLVPAHIISLRKLEKLREDKLWQTGKLKQYYIELSDIIREYIENRFKIQALEQTTEEIIYSFKSIAIDDESFSKLKQLLILADLVKFAKEQPLPNENEFSLANGFDFINGTKKEEDNLTS